MFTNSRRKIPMNRFRERNDEKLLCLCVESSRVFQRLCRNLQHPLNRQSRPLQAPAPLMSIWAFALVCATNKAAVPPSITAWRYESEMMTTATAARLPTPGSDGISLSICSRVVKQYQVCWSRCVPVKTSNSCPPSRERRRSVFWGLDH